jgi:RimJ/RimL family protein N-acetyltransferase
VTATRPPMHHEGRYIGLEPLTRELVPELFEALAHPAVFEGGYGGGPAGHRDTLEGFTEFAERYYGWGEGNVHAVRLKGGADDGRLVGTSTLGDFNLAKEYAHLGWTAYDPRVWGTVVNAEAKLLILGSAFDNGFGRVKIQSDTLNERSRGAIARLGATFEGIARRDRLRADGSWGDSAVFSVTIDDWERVRAGLLERLDAAGGLPVQLRDDH